MGHIRVNCFVWSLERGVAPFWTSEDATGRLIGQFRGLRELSCVHTGFGAATRRTTGIGLHKV